MNIIKPEEGKIFLKNLFGEQKIFEGEIKEVSLLKHKIVLGKNRSLYICALILVFF